MKEQGVPEFKIMEIIKRKSRDNSRTPVQWNGTTNAGFSTNEPWISVADNYQTVNAEAALEDKNSIFYHYKALIQLRKEYDIITHGDYTLLLEDHEQVFAYTRTHNDELLLVVNNFYGSSTLCHLPLTSDYSNCKILLSNYNDSSKKLSKLALRPYESIVYLLRK